MDLAKVKIVLDWLTQVSICDVQCFLGFAIFTESLSRIFSKIVLPFVQLTQKNSSFIWTTYAEKGIY